MHVRELIDILSEQPPDAEVELAVIAPVEEDSDDITVDRYPVDGVLPWNDDDEEGLVIWLIGGEDDDVDAFLDAVEQDSTEHAGPRRSAAALTATAVASREMHGDQRAATAARRPQRLHARASTGCGRSPWSPCCCTTPTCRGSRAASSASRCSSSSAGT